MKISHYFFIFRKTEKIKSDSNQILKFSDSLGRVKEKERWLTPRGDSHR